MITYKVYGHTFASKIRSFSRLKKGNFPKRLRTINPLTSKVVVMMVDDRANQWWWGDNGKTRFHYISDNFQLYVSEDRK